MPKFRTYIEGASGGEHLIEAEFTFFIGNDGIGSYEYWGCKGYDKGVNYIEDVNISSIHLVRDGIIKDSIDKFPSTISRIRKMNKDGRIYYLLENSKEIHLEEEMIQKIEKEIKETFDFTGDLDGDCY